MPRRGNVPKRKVLPYLIYNSVLVTKLVNSIMLDGKKGVAQKVVYGAFDIIKEKTDKDPLVVFTTALENIMPSPGGQGSPRGRRHLPGAYRGSPRAPSDPGSRWLTNYSRARSEKTMKERLAGEIQRCLDNLGSAVKKREDTHKMAESNKAFAHYRW